MRADVDALNESRARKAAEQGKNSQPIEIGIGLNTGDCVVGNMGSESRFDYTALGDAVNLASRLEGQCKTYGVKTVLGATTAAEVADAFAIIEIDLIRVRGKTEPERIFALLGDVGLGRDPRFAELRIANEDMRAAYAAHDWSRVLSALDRIEALALELGLTLDAYVTLYRQRTDAFLIAPPPPDWDGVFAAEVK